MPTKSFHRTDRVSAQLRRELGALVHDAVREHRLPSVSVSDVEVTRDLAHAKVFVTALMPEKSAEAVAGLIPRSRLLSSNNWGHTAYGVSACATRHVDRYLLRGSLPAQGTVCDDRPGPFEG